MLRILFHTRYYWRTCNLYPLSIISPFPVPTIYFISISFFQRDLRNITKKCEKQCSVEVFLSRFRSDLFFQWLVQVGVGLPKPILPINQYLHKKIDCANEFLVDEEIPANFFVCLKVWAYTLSDNLAVKKRPFLCALPHSILYTPYWILHTIETCVFQTSVIFRSRLYLSNQK